MKKTKVVRVSSDFVDTNKGFAIKNNLSFVDASKEISKLIKRLDGKKIFREFKI